jgi:hypothetical protein
MHALNSGLCCALAGRTVLKRAAAKARDDFQNMVGAFAICVGIDSDEPQRG